MLTMCDGQRAESAFQEEPFCHSSGDPFQFICISFNQYSVIVLHLNCKYTQGNLIRFYDSHFTSDHSDRK